MIKNKFLIFLFLFTFVACQSHRIIVDYNKEVDFYKYRTFNWLDSANDKDGDKFQDLANQKLKTKIQEVLAEKAITLNSKPDMLVSISLVERERVYHTPRHDYYHHHRYWGYDGFTSYRTEYYIESSILIALIEPGTKKSVWEGVIRDAHFTNISDETIEKMVRALFENFPPSDSEAYKEVK